MQSATRPPARNHRQSKQNLFLFITLSTVLLCFLLPNASAATPAGLSLGKSSGIVSGTPSTAETSSFHVRVSDSKGASTSKGFQITVSPAVLVTVTPATATVASAGTISFTAAVANTSNQAVTWSTTQGTISTSGLYQAPTVNANSTATVTATSVVDPTKSASASVTVTAVSLTLSGNFAAAQVGIRYSITLVAGGGTSRRGGCAILVSLFFGETRSATFSVDDPEVHIPDKRAARRVEHRSVHSNAQ